MRRRGYGISIAAFLVSATTLSPQRLITPTLSKVLFRRTQIAALRPKTTARISLGHRTCFSYDTSIKPHREAERTGYDPHGDDRSGGASVGLEDRCRPAMDTRLARRSAACEKKPDYSRQSDGRFRGRSWQHRPSSSAHQDRKRTLGDRRGHPHYRSDRRARPHQRQMASAASSAFVTCCRN